VLNEHESVTDACGCVNSMGWELKSSELKPIGTIGDPPGQHARGNGGEESPPKGQSEVRDDSDSREGQPENFALHEVIVAKSGLQPTPGCEGLHSNALYTGAGGLQDSDDEPLPGR
jgi:hypothetical protein